MAAVTLFKLSGDKFSDEFRGTFSGPDDRPSEWEYLSRNKVLQSFNLSFRVEEFQAPGELPEKSRSSGKKGSFINLNCSGDNPTTLDFVLTKDITEVIIQEWIRKSIMKVAPQLTIQVDQSSNLPDDIDLSGSDLEAELPPPLVTRTFTPRSTPKTEESVNNTPPPSPPEYIEDRSSWAGFAIGSSMIVAACAVFGAVIGNIIADDNENSQSYSDLALLKEDGSSPEFKASSWTERLPWNRKKEPPLSPFQEETIVSCDSPYQSTLVETESDPHDPTNGF